MKDASTACSLLSARAAHARNSFLRFKWIDLPKIKKKNHVIIYSLLCHSKLVMSFTKAYSIKNVGD